MTNLRRRSVCARFERYKCDGAVRGVTREVTPPGSAADDLDELRPGEIRDLAFPHCAHAHLSSRPRTRASAASPRGYRGETRDGTRRGAPFGIAPCDTCSPGA